MPSASSSQNRPNQATLLARALRLRCPACGQARIFDGWFRMNDPCPQCGRRFNRAPGYLLGSIYFNYGVTAVLVTAAYFAGYFSEALSSDQLLAVLAVFSIVFPMWFFRYARALWIAFDERWDPWPNDQERRQIERERAATSTND